MENFVELYKEETKELLNDVQDTLLELEDKPDDRELIDRVFRAMHNMKGNGAMFGFNNISAFTHDIETIYDKVRGGEVPVTPDLINLTLAACDQINLMLMKPNEDDSKQKEKVNSILEGFSQLLPEGSRKTSPQIVSVKNIPSTVPVQRVTDKESLTTYLIRFVPHADIFLTGTNPVLLLKELLELGDGYVIAHTDKVPSFEKFDPEKCYLYWTIILTTAQDTKAVQDVFIFVEDESKIRIEAVDTGEGLPSAELEEVIKNLRSNPGLLFEDIRRILSSKGDEKSQTENVPKESSEDRQEKDATEQSAEKAKSTVSHDAGVSTIRVPSEKLDNLINLVGELVTVQASLTQQVMKNRDSCYLAIAEEFERLTRDLRDIAMDIRLVPVGTLFSRYKRLVRDLSRKQGKEIRLTFEGGETELDKTIIERLSDPMVHLIRNSIDHGIESPEERQRKGKPREGHIHISAWQSGAEVSIRISDDGKGIDPEKIRVRAIDKGVISGQVELSDAEALRLIFSPGFSTAKEVSDISGRGVGMDVVKKNVEDLRGTVEVKSEVGNGTQITLRLPLTLGIIEGMVVRVGGEWFVLPLSVVQGCQEFGSNGSLPFKHREIIELRGEVIPFIRLRKHFAVTDSEPEREHLVISNISGKKIGLVVDEIIGEQQIVIKSLGKLYRNIEGLSGATLLGDGAVALILDVGKLIHIAEQEELQAVQSKKI